MSERLKSDKEGAEITMDDFPVLVNKRKLGLIKNIFHMNLRQPSLRQIMLIYGKQLVLYLLLANS